MSPLQLVSSGLIPASDLSDGVGETGGLELVLPKRITLPGTAWANEDRANLKPHSPGWASGATAAAVGEEATALVAEPTPCWPGGSMPFFKTAAAPPPPFCSW